MTRVCKDGETSTLHYCCRRRCCRSASGLFIYCFSSTPPTLCSRADGSRESDPHSHSFSGRFFMLSTRPAILVACHSLFASSPSDPLGDVFISSLLVFPSSQGVGLLLAGNDDKSRAANQTNNQRRRKTQATVQQWRSAPGLLSRSLLDPTSQATTLLPLPRFPLLWGNQIVSGMPSCSERDVREADARTDTHTERSRIRDPRSLNESRREVHLRTHAALNMMLISMFCVVHLSCRKRQREGLACLPLVDYVDGMSFVASRAFALFSAITGQRRESCSEVAQRPASLCSRSRASDSCCRCESLCQCSLGAAPLLTDEAVAQPPDLLCPVFRLLILSRSSTSRSLIHCSLSLSSLSAPASLECHVTRQEKCT